MSRVNYNEEYSYEVFDDGYDIFSEAKGRILTQRKPYDKPMDIRKTYEENAIMQIEDMLIPSPESGPTPNEIFRADLDYVAIMNDIVLPSQEEKGE